MADFLGMNFTPTAAAPQMWQNFAGSLTPQQSAERQQARASRQHFEGELSPQQKDLQRKMLLDKMSGASPQVVQQDRQAFLASLTPQEKEDRTQTIQQEQAFKNTLTPDQQSMRNTAMQQRQTAIVQAAGQQGLLNTQA